MADRKDGKTLFRQGQFIYMCRVVGMIVKKLALTRNIFLAVVCARAYLRVFLLTEISPVCYAYCITLWTVSAHYFCPTVR